MAIEVVTYRLRGGQIQPRQAGCGAGAPAPAIAGFYTQTFGAEKVVTVVDDAKTELLESSDFRGQKAPGPGGIEDPAYIGTTYVRASYQGRALRTTDGELVYSASEERVGQFIDEDQIGIA